MSKNHKRWDIVAFEADNGNTFGVGYVNIEYCPYTQKTAKVITYGIDNGPLPFIRTIKKWPVSQTDHTETIGTMPHGWRNVKRFNLKEPFQE